MVTAFPDNRSLTAMGPLSARKDPNPGEGEHQRARRLRKMLNYRPAGVRWVSGGCQVGVRYRPAVPYRDHRIGISE